MALTIRDIARMSGVSKSTVSRYLNNDSVSEETAKKIKEVIDETGYEMNNNARRLKSQKNNSIGIYVKGIQSTGVSRSLNTLSNELKKNAYDPFIMIGNNSDTEEDEIRDILFLKQQRVSGVIYGTDRLTPNIEKTLSELKVPIVLIGQKSSTLPYCILDNHFAGEILGEYLVSLGHNRLLFIAPTTKDIEVGNNRIQGVLAKFGQSDINFEYKKIYANDYSFEAAYSVGQEVLKYKPSIVIGTTDRAALGILHFLTENNIDVPNVTSLAGFGNYDFSKIVSPPLTTIEFDYETLAENTITLLLSKVEEKELQDKNPSRVPIELMVRESVSAPKKFEI